MKNVYLFDSAGGCYERRLLPETVPLEEFIERTGAVSYVVCDDLIDIRSARLVDGVLTEIKPAPRVLDYRESRLIAYPPLGDQLDAIWQAMESGLIAKVPNFYNPIAAVKAAYPKAG
jgi:hypothetical protein